MYAPKGIVILFSGYGNSLSSPDYQTVFGDYGVDDWKPDGAQTSSSDGVEEKQDFLGLVPAPLGVRRIRT